MRATINSIRARLHHDEIAREVETELRFHIEMRTRANIEAGMTPDEAQPCGPAKLRRFRQRESQVL